MDHNPSASDFKSDSETQRPAYLLHQINGTPQEIERLDDMHEAMKFYLGGRLSLAPLEGSSPMRILELGSGSGAWAIQAAETFPDADVLAIDLSPLPSRPLPQNLRFQIHDMANPFPFASETFDIVHARFLFVHIPQFEEALKRTMQLIKPGGWLLLDDMEAVVHNESGVAPDTNVFWEAFQQYMMSRDTSPYVGSTFRGIIESSNLFEEVNVRKLVISVLNTDETQADNGVGRITKSFKRWLNRGILAMKQSAEDNHMSTALMEAAQREIINPSTDVKMEIYLTWSRRHDTSILPWQP